MSEKPIIHLHVNDLPENLEFKGAVAVDSETMGLNLHRDRLCLVQLSAGDNIVHLVQFKDRQYRAPNLKRLLSNRKILKIFHFARYDVAAFYAYLGIVTQPIYCTKIAAKLTRTFTDKHGLKDLCKELLGAELNKMQQTSDWGADNLSEAQLVYAANDVLYLHRLQTKLAALLEREGRTKLAQAAFDFMPARAQLDLLGFDQPDLLEH